MIKNLIEEKLRDDLDVSHLEVVNESNNHNVPPGSESHFKVLLVSDDFLESKLITRHRRVNRILNEEIKLIHALSLHLYTLSEWKKKQQITPHSPPCLGGELGGEPGGAKGS